MPAFLMQQCGNFGGVAPSSPAFAGTATRRMMRCSSITGRLMPIDFATDPGDYRHWRLDFDGPVATLTLDVDPAGGMFRGTELKLNSYDLGADIELADAVTRLRIE